jgi:hypothetical protein
VALELFPSLACVRVVTTDFAYHYYIIFFLRRAKSINRGGHHVYLGLKVIVNQVFIEAIQMPGSVNKIKKRKNPIPSPNRA